MLPAFADDLDLPNDNPVHHPASSESFNINISGSDIEIAYHLLTNDLFSLRNVPPPDSSSTTPSLSAPSSSFIPSTRKAARRKLVALNPPFYYANKVLIALNEYDSFSLYDSLRCFCTPNVTIVHRLYSVTAPDAVQLGLQDQVFPNLEEFCSLMSIWNDFVPDGVFESSYHRICVDAPPLYVFIANMRFHGHQIVHDFNIFDRDLQCYRSVLNQIVVDQVLMYSGCAAMIDIQGSLATFVNQHGLIERIEFYFCLP